MLQLLLLLGAGGLMIAGIVAAGGCIRAIVRGRIELSADRLFSFGQYQQAIAAYDEALGLDLVPAQRAHALNYRGGAHYHLGRFNLAQCDWESAVELKPAHTDALRSLAWLGSTSPDENFRDGSAAVAYARRAIASAPGPDGDLYMVLATALAESGNMAGAIQTQYRAMRMADQRQATDWDREQAEQQMACYKDGLPYRWPPP